MEKYFKNLKTINFLLVLFNVTILISCQKKSEPQGFPIELIEKTWKHSYEENTSENYEIYRPENYQDFPESRFREVFHFKSNGECEYLVLAPNDAHYMATGNWTYDNKNKQLKIKKENEVKFIFEIVELSGDLLKVKKITYN